MKSFLTRPIRWIACAAGVVAVFALVGFFAVPPIVKWQLEERLAERLHRKVAIEKVRVNPFAPSLTVNGFAMQERDGAATAVSFEELYVNVSYASIFRLAPVIDEIRLVRPHVRLVRAEDKTYNYQDLIDESLAQPPSEGPPPKFSLNNISLIDGRIDFDDRPERKQHEITELRVGLPFISNLPHAIDIKVAPELSAKLNGTPIKAAGEVKPFKDTRETALSLAIEKLELPKYIDYSPVPLKFRVPSGSLDAQLTLNFSTSPILAIGGNVGLEKLRLEGTDGAPLVAVGALAADLGTIDLAGNRAMVKSVRIESPEVHVVRRRAGGINLLALAPAEGPKRRSLPLNR